MAYQIFCLLFVRATGTDSHHELQHELQQDVRKLKNFYAFLTVGPIRHPRAIIAPRYDMFLLYCPFLVAIARRAITQERRFSAISAFKCLFSIELQKICCDLIADL